jgi:cell division protein ZapA (FtsZ GTPase activity inhibitor)
MKIFYFLVVNCFLFASLVWAADEYSIKPENQKYHFECWENFNIDVEGKTVVINHYGTDGSLVEINEDGDLFIDREKVKTDRQSRELLKDYNQRMRDLISSAEKIGFEAAKVGGKGADLGLEAVSGILAVMCTDLEMDDLEDHLDKKAKKLEREAEKLEDKAKALEEQAEELEAVHDNLKDRISELDELEWF